MFKTKKIDLEKQGLSKIFGPLELKVMEVLWSGNGALSARDITDEVSVSGEILAFNSVNTILTRLCEKGLVSKKGTARKYLFSPVYSRPEMIIGSRKDILSSVLQDPVLFGAHAFETLGDELDEKTKEKLRKILS